MLTMFLKMKLLLLAAFALISVATTAQQVPKPATIQVDLSKKTNEPLKPIWASFHVLNS